MEKNRISRIQVKNLFGSVSYDIDMSENKPISIMIAPNGRGKSTILNLISFLFNPNNDTFNAFRTIPFDEFKCYLSNGKIVSLTQIKREVKEDPSEKAFRSRSFKELTERRVNNFFKDADFEFSIIEGETKQHTLPYCEALIEALEVDGGGYPDAIYSESYYNRRFSSSILSRLSYVWEMQKQYLDEDKCRIPVRYIKADRIQPVLVSPRHSREYDETHQESPLIIASKRISKAITHDVEEYNEAVSQAKDKLPQMFLDGEGSEQSAKEFKIGWNEYRNELNQFQEIGLITPTEDFIKGNKDITEFYQEKGSFLSTYLSAFRETTKPLRSIYKKLSLLKQIIDNRNRITGKKIEFGKQGISLFFNGRELPLDTLSSGEKHDLIMFYDLIFNIDDYGLVLVDEPEISLHIEWQESYLDILNNICQMNHLQAIIATHSPNIVNDHYDFLVDKGEVNG